MTRLILPALAVFIVAGPALAQNPRQIEQQNEVALRELLERSSGDNAQTTRERWQELLNEHPPAVRIVLQADPTLLQGDYLATYPRLAAFVKQHAEIARDPAFFLGQRFAPTNRSAEMQAMDMLEGVLAGIAVFTVALTAILVLGSVIRQVISQRRWTRQSRIQAEMQTKILDRLQSNEDLLAYIQTPVGRRFLESGPAPVEMETRTLGSPYGRILWSAQAGVVLVALGIGLWLVQMNVMEAVAPAFRTMGVLAMALGFGALLSGAASYLLSVRFGLIGETKA
jgi:hypothetical protein